jgi:hypothetical protein
VTAVIGVAVCRRNESPGPLIAGKFHFWPISEIADQLKLTSAIRQQAELD